MRQSRFHYKQIPEKQTCSLFVFLPKYICEESTLQHTLLLTFSRLFHKYFLANTICNHWKNNSKFSKFSAEIIIFETQYQLLYRKKCNIQKIFESYFHDFYYFMYVICIEVKYHQLYGCTYICSYRTNH